MNNKCKLWRGNSIYIESFPKHDTTLIYNSSTKQYEFRKGVIKIESEKKVQKKPLRVIKNYYLNMAIAAIIGVALAGGIFFMISLLHK